MASPQIIDIWRALRLPGPALAELLIDAAKTASDPRKSVLDCPFPYPTDAYSKACKVAWRVAFRLQKERGCVPLFTTETRLAA